MIIYGALLIPFIIAFFLYYFFKERIVWWELFIPLFVSLIFIFLMKTTVEAVQVSSKEYWGSFIQRVEYYEEWDEYIHQTCTRSCCCDSNGANCSTETYDCSYVSYHPAYWKIVTNNGEHVSISRAEYQRIKSLFNNEEFTDMNRSYHSIDGDMYYSTWNNDSATAVQVTTVHTYENRVKAADQSVFHFEKVNKVDIKRFGLIDYPSIEDKYKMPAVLGDNSPQAVAADKKFQYINGLLGKSKQVRVFVLLFKNQSIDAAFYQESYWSGANMNEFVICIGTDNANAVKWAKVFSWTRSELLKVQVKQLLQRQKKLDLDALAYFTQVQLEKQFVRRDFKEFDYLTVEPPTWAVLLAYMLTLGINILISFWIIRNDYL